jgi:superfamily II DNA or RNA helicase
MALVRGVACRFLIADAVGLGKTIQAGLMIAETLERAGEGRVLVVAPASLREQWAGELRDRFALDPVLLDSASILNAPTAHASGTNPWAALPLVITSIDYVKRPEVIRSLEALIWDLVVFDEAHALAGRSDRAAASAALATRARAVVMLSATPHSGDQAAFERLRSLGDLRGEFPLLTFRRSRLVLDGAAPRHVRLIRVRATPGEQQMHAALQEYADLSSHPSKTPGARLAISVLQRRATSSAASLAASLHRRLAWLTDDPARLPPSQQLGLPFDIASQDDSAPDEELSAPALPDRTDELARLTTLLMLAREAARSESKLTAVRRFLARTGERAIVFTEYRDTLSTIAAALGPGHAQVHGALSLRERHHEVRRFTHGDARLLLATDAASEGLNLQRRCRLVIHLEVPWTPLRVEQRIGRVDRLGQERSVHSIHLLAAGTGEELMAARLAERSRAADDALAGARAPGSDPQLRTDRSDAAQSSESIDSTIAVAPTDHDAVREPASCLDTGLLQHECRHIALARELDKRAAHTGSQRPFETIRRRPRGRRSVVGLRLAFVDASGLLLWESLIGITLPPGAPGGFALDPEALTQTDKALGMAQSELERLQQELTPGLRLAIARNAAIARTLEEQRARLSGLLLQPRLFDRRYERARSAQQELLQRALEQVDEHRARLAPRASSRLDHVRHVFSLFVHPR